MGGRANSGWAALLVAVLATMLQASGAGAATVANGDFESGTLAGWHVHRVTEAGNWFAYSGIDAPIGSKRKPNPASPVQAPPQGAYAATSDEFDPDTPILYQDIALEPGFSHQLSMLVYYNSYKPIAVPVPSTLSVDDEILAGQKNQQYRIDVMKPEAPIESVKPADILRTVFATKAGDPQSMVPRKVTANLSAFAGQTVRLRIANSVHDEVFNAGIDAVSILSTPAGQSASGGSKAGGSRHGPRLFDFERLRANRHNGTATLRVRVSGPGLLRAKGIKTSGRSAHAGEVRGLRKPIEPVTVPLASARTVTIHLRPTPAARAILRNRNRNRHRLRIAVEVTYMPVGAASETASVPVTFELTVPPRRRS